MCLKLASLKMLNCICIISTVMKKYMQLALTQKKRGRPPKQKDKTLERGVFYGGSKGMLCRERGRPGNEATATPDWPLLCLQYIKSIVIAIFV